jgi:signal transduction histidine kinase
LGILFSLPLAFSLLLYVLTLFSEQTDDRLLSSQNLGSCVERLHGLADETQAAERSYLVTGDEDYVHIFRRASATLPSQINSCNRAADGRPADFRRQITGAEALVQNRFKQAEQVFEIQRALGFGSAIETVKNNNSESTMNDIRRKFGELEAKLGDEQSRYRERQRSLTRFAYLSFIIGSLILLAVMFWLYSSQLSNLHARDVANAQLQRVNAELESRIQERTKDLTRANEELQQFAYVASHDLQEPLRTITSFTQLLETRYKGRLDEDADEFIGYIVASSRRMTDLINGLLALGRLRKSGQATGPVSFDELLDEAKISLQAAIRESGAEILSDSLPSLVVDRIQFAQVLQNLISNAIKYRREVPPCIRINARRDVTSWVFSVSDNGRGFNQQFAERIFGLFQRLHPHEARGTGMGLSIARRILERHGGRIWAESQEGVGTTFFFTVPLSLETKHVPEPAEVASGEPS